MTFARKSRVAAALALALGMSSAAVAQETSSGMRGKIVGPQGNPAANTKITIIHQPSGTVKEFVTNESGAFNAKGLRVGGPYTVIVDSEVFRDKVEEGISLNLGETYRLNVQLADANADMERIVVTGSVPLFTSSGSSSSFGQEDVLNAASVGRDIKDIVRSNPLVTILPGSNREMSVAGMNPRFNSITVDGIGQNDDFGLNSGGYPTNRSPIPFEALDQVSVDVAPFNAKASGFSGALINSNFKSGTNEFKGGFFYEEVFDDLTGTPTNRVENENGELVLEDVEIDLGGEKTYGFSLGGPILKDKLFFFTTYEKFELPTPLEFGPAGSSVGSSTIANVENINTVQGIASSRYGVDDIGGYTGNTDEEDEKLVFKLDWNISDEHRASLTYQYNKGNQISNLTERADTLRLNSAWYDRVQTLNNISAKLYSDWTDDFSTEVSVTQKNQKQESGTFSDLPHVVIRDVTEGGDLVFGTDRNRHANELEVDKFEVKLDAEYLYGDHNFGFGVSYSKLDTYNLYLPNAKGYLEFASIEDFESGLIDTYEYENGVGNDISKAAANFSQDTLSLYVQDSWDILDDVTLTYGVRYERFGASGEPLYNASSYARTGYNNTENLDGIDIILPRLGFKWYVNEDLTLRGGVGRFSGGQPNVWISNAYSNSGVSNAAFDIDERQLSVTEQASIMTNILPEALTSVQNAESDGHVNLLDPNFDIPSDWRYQLAADFTFDIPGLGEDFAWSNEILYIDKQDAAKWVDVSLTDDDLLEEKALGALNLYNDDDNRYDILLTNAESSGRSVILSTSLSKSWDNGLSFNASYTNQDITEGNAGTSSTARSNYRYDTAINRGEPVIGTAAFEIEHRFTLNLGYKTEFFDGYNTSFNLFFERRSGKPFSHVINWGSVDDYDSPWNLLSPGLYGGNYLAYIPTADDANVKYTSDEARADLMQAIDERGLSQYAGGFVDKGSSTTPWVNTLDLSIRQEVPGIMEGHKGTVYLVVDNLLNLIDSSQGKVYTNEFGTSRLYRGTIDPTDNKLVIDYVNDDNLNFEAAESTWRIKVGVRYDF